MIVVDASAGIAALLGAGAARRVLAREQLHVPHLVDVEVANVVRRLHRSGHLDAQPARRVLHTWQRLAMTRYPQIGLLDRIWGLRDNLSAYDAAYVALAEALHCDVLTADTRLARAPGLRCAVTVVPN